MLRFCLIGPTHPYRGGIAHYTTLLAQHLRKNHETLLISFSRQYPKWMYPGKTDRDPSAKPLKTDAEFVLDPLNPFSWWRTIRRIREWQADVVILQWWVPFWAPAWSIISRFIKYQSNKPRVIYICHNVLPHEIGWFGKLILPWVFRVALGASDGFIVHSRYDGDVLQKYLPGTNFQVTPLPTYEVLGSIDNGKLPAELPVGTPLLLFCGFVRPYKGLDVLLDALPSVLSERRLHLLIAGEFWQDCKTYYRNQIDRLKLNHAVSIIDQYLPNETLAACIAKSDVIVLPYRSATQSAIIQLAFGQRRPVITTNVGGLAEVVEHGKTGLVVPPGDPQALAVAINRFFDEALGPVFSENIRNQSHRFAWQRLIESLLHLIQ